MATEIPTDKNLSPCRSPPPRQKSLHTDSAPETVFAPRSCGDRKMRQILLSPNCCSHRGEDLQFRIYCSLHREKLESRFPVDQARQHLVTLFGAAHQNQFGSHFASTVKCCFTVTWVFRSPSITTQVQNPAVLIDGDFRGIARARDLHSRVWLLDAPSLRLLLLAVFCTGSGSVSAAGHGCVLRVAHCLSSQRQQVCRRTAV